MTISSRGDNSEGARLHHRAAMVAVVVVVSLALTGCFDNMFPANSFDNGRTACNRGNLLCKTDNNNITYWLDPNMSQTVWVGAKAAMVALGADTELTSTEVANRLLDDENNGETDMIVSIDNSLPSYRIGASYCEDSDFPSSGRCDQAYLFIHHDLLLALLSTSQETNSESYRSVVCHESGHQIGLLHGADALPEQDSQNPVLGCMVDGTTISVAIAAKTLGSHNVTTINDNY